MEREVVPSQVSSVAQTTVTTPTTLKDSLVDDARIRFSKTIAFKVYLAFHCAFTITEPFLVAFKPHRHNHAAQVGVLAASTVLFPIGLLGTLSFMNVLDGDRQLSIMERAIHLFDGEVLLELTMLVFGWVTIFELPGFAALRCLRVLRLLWYFELYHVQEPVGYNPSKHGFSPVKAVQLSLDYLERLSMELFTSASRGGVVVLAMFFYLTYLFGVVFWYEMGNLDTSEGKTCKTLAGCFLVMMRLALYDGTGLDYLTAVVESGNSGYAALLILYICLSAIILLNGLIGVFGTAFVMPDSSGDGGEGSEGDKAAGATEQEAGEERISTQMNVLGSRAAEHSNGEVTQLLLTVLSEVQALKESVRALQLHRQP
jgi:hypothetical protein